MVGILGYGSTYRYERPPYAHSFRIFSILLGTRMPECPIAGTLTGGDGATYVAASLRLNLKIDVDN